MKFYSINETEARRAHEANSMRYYTENEKSNEYQSYVKDAYAIGEERKYKYPDQTDRIDYLCDLYARKLANWYNKYFRIESMCPSVLVSGAGNFPTKKKERQNAQRKRHWGEWERIQQIVSRIRSCGSRAIKSNDEKAIEELEVKIERLTELQETMKAVNAYYRKNKTLEGCPDLTMEQIAEAEESMKKDWHIEDKPFPSFELTSNGANIRRLQERLSKLKEVKEAGTQEHDDDETGVEGLKVVENAEAMRIQLIFDGKPNEDTRNMLKHWGFKWSPRYTAWQRVLNENGKYATRKLIEELKRQ